MIKKLAVLTVGVLAGKFLAGFVIKENENDTGFIMRDNAGFGLDDVAEAATVAIAILGVQMLAAKTIGKGE